MRIEPYSIDTLPARAFERALKDSGVIVRNVGGTCATILTTHFTKHPVRDMLPHHVIMLCISSSLFVAAGCYDLQIDCDTDSDCVAFSDTEPHVCRYRHCIPETIACQPAHGGAGCTATETNICGGDAVLGGVPGEACGPCEDGVYVCINANEVWCREPSNADVCGGCGRITSVPQSACGPCGDGAWGCGIDGGLVCTGTTEVNECGGCTELGVDPDFICESGGVSGVYACSAADTVVCVGFGDTVCDTGDDPNVRVGAPCGVCSSGRMGCVENGVLECLGSNPDLNACGGCAPLPGRPGAPCGRCGEWECGNDDNALRCNEASNFCGGCLALANVPGTPCGGGGLWACTGTEDVTCGPAGANLCGGLEPLVGGVPGIECGVCGDGITICASPNLVVCVDDRDQNACGGCGLLSGVPGTECGLHHRWRCETGSTDVICAPEDSSECALVTQCGFDDGCCPADCTEDNDMDCAASSLLQLSASEGSFPDRVELSWNPIAGATEYVVFRNSTTIASVSDVRFSDTGASAPTIDTGAIIASDGVSHTRVTVSAPDIQVFDGDMTEYRVSARNGTNELSSDSAIGFRGTGSVLIQWQSHDGDQNWDDVGVSGSLAEDPLPPARGTTRWYRARVSMPGAVTATSDPDAGFLATCSDGEKNGDESAVDCGGSCGPCATPGFVTVEAQVALRGRGLTIDIPLVATDDFDTTIRVATAPAWLTWNDETHSFAGMPTSRDLGAHAIELSLESEDSTVVHDTMLIDIEVREERAVDVEMGWTHGCALLESGNMRCWGLLAIDDGASSRNPHSPWLGYDALGRLGTDLPPGIGGDIDVGEEATGLAAGAEHTCALLANGEVLCWGEGSGGALGNGSPEDVGDDERVTEQEAVELPTRALDITAGIAHTCVVLDGGGLRCWGVHDFPAAENVTFGLEGYLTGMLGLGLSAPAVLGDNEPVSAIPNVPLPGPAMKVDAFFTHTCARLQGGTVSCWGFQPDESPHLGYQIDGPVGDDETPDAAGALQLGFPVTELAVGSNQTCALLGSGSVACWGEVLESGSNTSATLFGFNSTSERVEVLVSPIQFEVVDVGFATTCGVRENGDVLCWGFSNGGYLGSDRGPTGLADLLPSDRLALPEPMTDLSTGYLGPCAISNSGRVYCWGAMGGWPEETAPPPGEWRTADEIQPLELTNFRPRLRNRLPHALRANQSYTFSLEQLADDHDIITHEFTLPAWLRFDDATNSLVGTPPNSGVYTVSVDAFDGLFTETVTTELRVVGSDDVITDVDAGAEHVCAQFADGSARCWGTNGSGQLGLGHTDDIGDDEHPNSEARVDFGIPIAELAAGGAHTCARLNDGQIRCWGDNSLGQLGNPSNNGVGATTQASTAAATNIGGPATRIVVGDSHTCALRDDNAVLCWGSNASGQLGTGSQENVNSPLDAGSVDLGRADSIVDIAAGTSQTCVLFANSDILCWGDNTAGVLGSNHIGLLGDDETPAEVVGASFTVPDAVSLAIGDEHACARTSSGPLYCWGNSDAIGDGLGNDAVLGPIDHGAVSLAGDAAAVAAGKYHTCAIIDAGALRCWGSGAEIGSGLAAGIIIGDDDVPTSIAPVDVGASVVDVAAGDGFTCALLATGGVRCWGRFRPALGLGSLRNVGDNEAPFRVREVEVYD